MPDLVYVGLALLFFLLTWLYARARDRVLSVLLLAYLGYALLRPEKF